MRKEFATDVTGSKAETTEQISPGKYNLGRVLDIIFIMVLIISLFLAAVSIYASFVSTSGSGMPNILGVRFLAIHSDSMYPSLQPGDLIIDTAVKDPATLKMGDIVTYWTVIDGERVLNTHRITDIYDNGAYHIFETKGDRNTIADPWAVHESEIVGKFNFRIPGAGKVLDYLQSPTGMVITLLVPVLLFVAIRICKKWFIYVN